MTVQLPSLEKFKSRGIKNKMFPFFTSNTTRMAGAADGSAVEF